MRVARHHRCGIDLDIHDQGDVTWHRPVGLLPDRALDPGRCRNRCLGRDGRSSKTTDGTQGTADEKTTLQHCTFLRWVSLAPWNPARLRDQTISIFLLSD